jgi:peroxin-2
MLYFDDLDCDLVHRVDLAAKARSARPQPMPASPNSDQTKDLPLTKFRVNQLDALMLDDEISTIIKGWIGATLSMFDGRLKLNFDQIILWCAKVICRYVPLLLSNSTFAMDMQGLYYQGHWTLKLLYAAIDSLLPALHDRVSGDLRRFFGMLNLVNYLIFIRHGKYPTLLHRMMQLEMMPISQNLASSVDYEFMHRQLVWQAMTEFSLVVVPWIKSHLAPGGILLPVRNAIARTFVRLYRRGSNKIQAIDSRQGCQLCHHPSPAMSQCLESCSHTFCYYCITDWQRNNTMECPVCVL